MINLRIISLILNLFDEFIFMVGVFVCFILVIVVIVKEIFVKLKFMVINFLLFFVYICNKI